MAKLRQNLIGRSHPHIISNRGTHIVSGAVEVSDECRRPRGRKKMHRLLLYYRAWTGYDFVVLFNGSRMGRSAECVTYPLQEIRKRSAPNITYVAERFGIVPERLYELIETHAPTKFIPYVPYATIA